MEEKSQRANPTRPESRPSPWVTRKQRMWLIAAFVVGLLFFLLIWNKERQNRFFKVAPVAPPVSGEEYQPLPVPLPGEVRSTVGPGIAPPANGEGVARIEETRPAPPPPVQQPRPAAPAAPAANAPLKTIDPQPISRPQPAYPRDLLNAGIGGHVVIRATVGSNGEVIDTSIAEPSGQIKLDRAANLAVKRWRFSPATQNGRPVVGSVLIPFDFNPEPR